MAAYRIKNWVQFQHYKHRHPPWIKLYRDLLNDPDWYELDPKLTKILIMLWLIASEGDADGTLPPTKKLAFRLREKESTVIKALEDLHPWVYQDASTMLAQGYQDAIPEGETETETETEGEGEGKRKKPHPPPPRIEVAKGVLVEAQELDSLNKEYGDKRILDYAQRVSEYQRSKGKRYRDHGATIRSWLRKDGVEKLLEGGDPF